MPTTPTPAPAAFDFLDLSYRPDLGVLNIRWLRSVSFGEMQQGFQAALREGQQQATRWLVDVRRRTELEADSSQWVARQLLPQAAAQVAPAVLRVAYLLSPARAELLRSNEALREATTAAQAPTQPYRLQTFLDEGPAVQWLQTAG